jgi:molybdate transport system substrate-binding protein
MRWASRIALAVVVCAALGLVGCSSAPPGPSGVVTVLASPSLTDAITAVARRFTTDNPGVEVAPVFQPDGRIPGRTGGSPPPDVIAAEDPATLTAAGVTTEPVHFAQGQIVLAVPAGNPALVTGPADLSRPQLRLAGCNPEEPCGQVTAEVLAAAGVTLPEGALTEPDVRAALRRVTGGTADAALVYRSDALTAGDKVMIIEFPQSSAALSDFVATVPANAPNPGLAQEFLDYLTSEAVRDELVRTGFRPPA